MERKLDATQEVIIDQEQTIEKFRELVRHLQADILELRERGESQQREGESRESIGGSASPVMNLNVQLKSSTIKAHSRVSEGDQETSLRFSLCIYHIRCSLIPNLLFPIPSFYMYIACSLIPSLLPVLDFVLKPGHRVKSGSDLGMRLQLVFMSCG